MAFYLNTFAAKPHDGRLVRKGSNRLLDIVLVCCALLVSGCISPPTGTVKAKVSQTVWSTPVKVTLITLPGRFYTNPQSAAGYLWATRAGLFSPSTIRIDPKSNEVIELSRPRSDGPNDFLVDENSIWYTDGEALFRVDIETNQLTATIEDVGIPFALGDGAVWTYNDGTQIVSGIDTKTNQIRTQIAVPGRPYHQGSFTFGAGSIWQFSYMGDVTMWQDRNIHGDALSSIVSRIDPYTKKIIAEIPVGLFTNIVDSYISPDRIHFVAGSIWVLGRSGSSTFMHPGHIDPFAKRIDVETNRLIATIPLTGRHSNPMTPVFLDGELWISVSGGYNLSGGSELLKIDLQTNQIAGVFSLYAPGLFEPPNWNGTNTMLVNEPQLTVMGGALWGIGPPYSGPGKYIAIRIDFQVP